MRGLEFGSYALALGRQRNVEIGNMFDTRTYEWLDASETKETNFFMSLQRTSAAGTDRSRTHLKLHSKMGGGQVYGSESGIRIEMF